MAHANVERWGGVGLLYSGLRKRDNSFDCSNVFRLTEVLSENTYHACRLLGLLLIPILLINRKGDDLPADDLEFSV